MAAQSKLNAGSGGGGDYTKLIREQTRQIDIDTFKERGLKKVSVINAKKINELIAQAVGATIEKLEIADVNALKEDKAQVIMDSINEFKRLMNDQQKKAGEDDAATAAATSGAMTDEIRDLKASFMNMQAKAAKEQFERETAAEDSRQQMAAALDNIQSALALQQQNKSGEGKQLDSVNKNLVDLRGSIESFMASNNGQLAKQLSDIRSAVESNRGAEAAAIKDELVALREAITGAVDKKLEQRVTAERNELSASLGDQLKAMHEAIVLTQARPSFDANQLETLVKTTMGAMQQNMMRDFEKSGVIKGGHGMEGVDSSVAGAVVNAVFKDMADGKTESNLGAISSRVAKVEGGASATSALDKLKALKKGK